MILLKIVTVWLLVNSNAKDVYLDSIHLKVDVSLFQMIVVIISDRQENVWNAIADLGFLMENAFKLIQIA